ncbi:MAG: squalene/phytoene synthase family protein [Pseudomonadota bacterium]|nr:squalene/phytoene synthase family protein [Pseudomonadota bacterium]
MNPFAALILQAHPDAASRIEAWLRFAHEVSLAPGKVSEPGLGEIRLKWWSEAALEALETGTVTGTGAPRAHPAVTAFHEAVQGADIRPAPGLVRAFIEAHSLDLEPRPYADIEALRADATARWGNQLRVCLQLLSVTDEAHHHAANHVGAGFGIMQVLFGAGIAAARGRQLLSGPEGRELDQMSPDDRARLGGELCGQAAFHLDRAFELLPRPRKEALPALRFGLAARALITAAEAAGADPLALPAPEQVARTFPLRLTWARLRGRYG